MKIESLCVLQTKLEVARQGYGKYGMYVTNHNRLTELQLEIYLQMIAEYNNTIAALEKQIQIELNKIT